MKQVVRTSTVGLAGGRPQNIPAAKSQQLASRIAMDGFDQMPKSLRAFLNEYGGYFPKAAQVQLVDTLKAGYGIKITTPDGKTHTIAPDLPARRY